MGVPQRVPGVSDAIDVAAGSGAEFAIVGDHTLMWWGRLNVSSPLRSLHPNPAPMPGLPKVTQVRSGTHTCAVSADHHVFCWGNNDFGQLGDGSTVPRVTPLEVPNLGDVSMVTVGAGFTCAMTTAGTALCWGANDAGQLGRGGTQDPNPNDPKPFAASPGPVVGLPPIVSLSAGFNTACAVGRDHNTYCWGINHLIDGSAAWPWGTPALVQGFEGAEEIAIGDFHMCALKLDHTVWCGGDITVSGHRSNGLGQVFFQ